MHGPTDPDRGESALPSTAELVERLEATTELALFLADAVRELVVDDDDWQEKLAMRYRDAEGIDRMVARLERDSVAMRRRAIHKVEQPT